MKTKALALLVVMAMLATLFVAIPASATLTDDLTTCSPTVNVHFTSGNTPDSAAIDPDAASVGTKIYAWIDFGGLAEGAYVTQAAAFLSYDPAVVTPWNIRQNKLATTNATGARAYINGDLYEYDANEMTGYYTASASCTFGSYLGISIEEAGDIATAIANGECDTMDDYTEDTWYQLDSTGSFVVGGFAFQKIADGKVGITISGNDKVLNGKPVAYPTTLLPDCATVIIGDHPTSYRILDGASKGTYTYIGGGTAAGAFTDLSPVDSDEPEEPAPEAAIGNAQASLSEEMPNAFFYVIDVTVPTEEGIALDNLTLTMTRANDNKSATKVFPLTGISGVNLKIASTILNIPEEYKDVAITSRYVLNYTLNNEARQVELAEKTATLSELQ